MRYMEKSTIMLMGYLEVPRATVSWPLKPRGLRLYSERVASIHQLPKASWRRNSPLLPNNKMPPHGRCEGTSLTSSSLKPRSTTIASSVLPHRRSPSTSVSGHRLRHEPSRDVLLEHGYIAHIRSIGEEKVRQARGVTRRRDG